MNFELIGKIILGSGLFAIFITEILRIIRRSKLKERLTKEIVWELFVNEYCAMFIIRDFQNLQKDPSGFLGRHIFKTQVIDSIISSGYFVNLDFDFSQLTFEFAQRFKIVQYELEKFFTLNDDQKIMPVNLELLKKGESVSKLLLSDLNNNLRKLKKQYYHKWHEDKMKLFEKKYNIKIDEKEKREFLEKIRAEMKNENNSK